MDTTKYCRSRRKSYVKHIMVDLEDMRWLKMMIEDEFKIIVWTNEEWKDSPRKFDSGIKILSVTKKGTGAGIHSKC